MRPRRDAQERDDLSAETIAAVDGAVAGGLERHTAGLATLGAHGVKHFAGAAAITGAALLGVAAGLAALGLIGKALLGEKLLLAGSEGELVPAILADDGLVLKHVIPRLN